jgi:biofilm protein TabA
MIFDSLNNLNKYSTIPCKLEICNFIKSNNIFELPNGDIEINEDKLFVKVLRYIPKVSNELFFETHKNYADVQILFDGIEAMQIADVKDLEFTNEFIMEGDFKFYKGSENISEIVVSKNKFIVFFPGEAHKPGCLHNNQSTPVLKLVFKILVS